jgi:hypothetical protein
MGEQCYIAASGTDDILFFTLLYVLELLRQN